MRLLLLVLVVGCHTSEMDFPVGGGGGGGVGGTLRHDAAVDGAGSGSAFAATACVLTDSRDLTSCRTTGSSGLTVTLGTSTAITADDGTFTIAAPAVAGVLWDVTGTPVVESVTAFTGQTRIPVMDLAMFNDLQSVNGLLPVAGTGSVMIRIARGGSPVAGEQVVVSPPNGIGTFYDPVNAGDAWTTTATGPFGTAFIPDVTTGTASLTLSAGGTAQATVSGIPIIDGGVTFVQAVLL